MKNGQYKQAAVQKMNDKIFLTSEVAKAANVHPNTVRLYENGGLIAPAKRTPSGYRQFTLAHIYQMRLARLAFQCTWIGGEIRRSALKMVKETAASNLIAALDEAMRFSSLIDKERAQAEAAASFLESWVAGNISEVLPAPMHIGEASQLLNSTIDSLRNWERNGLIKVPRDPHNGYRLYGGSEIGRLRVIRMLLGSGYSMMAVLRLVQQLDRGRKDNLRQVLDTPRSDEEVFSASDHWLTALAELHEISLQAIALLEEFHQTLH